MLPVREYEAPTGGCSTQLVRMFIESRNFSSSERRDSDIFPHTHAHTPGDYDTGHDTKRFDSVTSRRRGASSSLSLVCSPRVCNAAI